MHHGLLANKLTGCATNSEDLGKGILTFISTVSIVCIALVGEAYLYIILFEAIPIVQL